MEESLKTIQNRNTWLDVLRGIAIVGVLSVHTVQTTDTIAKLLGGSTSDTFSNITSLGQYGVEVFFFLSGWLMAALYGNSSGEKNFSKRRFWAKRIARILPLYFIFLMVGLLEDRLAGAGPWHVAQEQTLNSLTHNPVITIFLTLTFMQWLSAGLWGVIIPGGWSIQAEMGHYLLFSLMRKMTMEKIIRIIVICYLLLAVAHINFQLNPPTGTLKAIYEAVFRLNLMSTGFFFLIGILAQKLSLANWDLSVLLRVSRRTKVYSLVIFLCWMTFPLAVGNNIQALGYLLIALVSSILVMEFSRTKKTLEILGKYSYFIYFCHFHVLSILRYLCEYFSDQFTPVNDTSLLRLFLQVSLFILFYLITMGVSLLLAIPSYKYFERPILRIAHKI